MVNAISFERDKKLKTDELHLSSIENVLPSVIDPVTKTTKPSLDKELPKKSRPAQLVLANLLETMQNYVSSIEEPIKLKQDQAGDKITKTNKLLREKQREIVNTQKTIDTWDFRKSIASQVLNGVSILSGIGLVAAGDAFTGGSLIVSGAGGIASSLMNYFEWNPTLTAATSLVSGIVGVVGGLGGAAANIYGHLGNQKALEASWRSLSSICDMTYMVTSLLAGGLSGAASIASNNNKSLMSNLEALQSQTNSSLRLLQDKYMGSTTAFQGAAKNFSDLFKNITRAQTRYTRAMRVITAEFPA